MLLELHYWEGMSTSELASVIEAPQGTVKSRLRRARALLAQALASAEEPMLAELTHRDVLESWVQGVRGIGRDDPGDAEKG